MSFMSDEEGDGENISPIKRVYVPKENTYGALEGVPVGTWWETRMECSRDSIHRYGCVEQSAISYHQRRIRLLPRHISLWVTCICPPPSYRTPETRYSLISSYQGGK